MVGFEDARNLVADLVDASASDFVAGDQQFDVEALFNVSEQEKSQQYHAGGEHGGNVKASAGGHADGCDYEKCSRRCQAGGEAARVKDGAGSDEANAGNDLGS